MPLLGKNAIPCSESEAGTYIDAYLYICAHKRLYTHIYIYMCVYN
jgi:hypothetical protein